MNTNYRIVVGIDGSQGGRRALEWAVQEATTRGGTVQVVFAWSWDGIEIGPVVAADRDSALERAQRILRTEVKSATAGLESPPSVAAEAVEGPPAAVLTKAAQNADLLVLGSHGHGRLRHSVLGSVSDECVRRSACPVVVIPVPAYRIAHRPVKAALPR